MIRRNITTSTASKDNLLTRKYHFNRILCLHDLQQRCRKMSIKLILILFRISSWLPRIWLDFRQSLKISCRYLLDSLRNKSYTNCKVFFWSCSLEILCHDVGVSITSRWRYNWYFLAFMRLTWDGRWNISLYLQGWLKVLNFDAFPEDVLKSPQTVV